MTHRTLKLLLTLPLLASCGGGDKGSDAAGADSTSVDATGNDAGTSNDGSSTGDASTSGATSSPTTTAADETSMPMGGTTMAQATPPAAPTDLIAGILEGGVHLTWKDASDNEDQFVIENKAAGAPEFVTVIELPFDSVTYHDISVEAGVAYTYRIKATNADGESLSNEVMVQVP